MAHFAELDNINKVLKVIVVDNKDTSDENGVEKEEIGIAFCKSLFGENTKWVQTSYNASFRGIYAAVGDTYDEEADIFVARYEGVPIYIDDSSIIDVEEATPTPALEAPTE